LKTKEDQLAIDRLSIVSVSMVQRVLLLHVTVGHGKNLCKLEFCLTVYHQLGKVIQMNQLDATMIY